MIYLSIYNIFAHKSNLYIGILYIGNLYIGILYLPTNLKTCK